MMLHPLPELVRHKLNRKAQYSTWHKTCDGRMTPLAMAVERGHNKAARVLLETGARLDGTVEEATGEETKSLVHVAAYSGFGEICGLLVQAMTYEDHAKRVKATVGNTTIVSVH